VHWPAFNLADVAITSGAALLIMQMLTQGKAVDTGANGNYNHSQ
jgi:signal peptidase II